MSSSLRPRAPNGTWVGIGIALLLAAIGAAATGLVSGMDRNTAASVTNAAEIRTTRDDVGELKGDVKAIRVSIEGFSEDIKEIKEAVK